MPTTMPRSAPELEAATKEDGDVLDAIVQMLHEAFPIRKDAADLKAVLRKSVGALNAGVQDGLKFLDADANGAIDRKEVGAAYKAAKEYFMKGATTLQTMGPMLAMVRRKSH